MGVVTKLEIQKRNKKRVSVYIDEQYILSLSLDEAARLSKGQVLDAEQISALMNQSAVGLAMDRALRLLTLRPRSVAEIKQNLARKDIAPPVIDAAIERLTMLGYIDDHAFVTFWVQDRMRFKPASPRALRYELQQKGIESDVIDSALAELDADDAAYRAAQSQLRKLRGSTKREFRDKLSAFLGRRGFHYGVIRTTLQRLFEEIEADELEGGSPEYFADNDNNANLTYDET